MDTTTVPPAPASNAGSDVGLYGLAVMGQNFALNMASKGFAVSVANRSPAKVDTTVMRAKAEGIDTLKVRMCTTYGLHMDCNHCNISNKAFACSLTIRASKTPPPSSPPSPNPAR